jgi:hypothetical protein
MELNKLKFCHKLNPQTPNCVLLEVCRSYGIKISADTLTVNYRAKVLKYINEFNPETLQSEFMPSESDIAEITKIATFINSSVSWSYNTLTRAYNFWKSNTLDCKYFGDPTPIYPESITLIQCYTICKDLNLTPHTSDNELIYYAKILQNPHYLKHLIFSQLQINITTFDTLKTYKNIKDDLVIDKKHWLLCKGFNPEVLRYIIPESATLAVALASIYFDIDISTTQSPICEFVVLANNPSTYIPIDPIIGSIFAKNPEAFKFSTNFNPQFCTEFYSPTILQKLVKFEGYYNTTDPDYTVLQMNSIMPTFYSGFQLYIKNKMSICTLEPLEHFSNSEIISYGLKNDLTAFTINELIDSFNNHLAFILPNNETLSTNSINKLFNISKILNYHKMIATIKTVRSYEGTKAKPMGKLIREYNNATEEGKLKILQMAKCLLQLGFRMRGWLSGEYPVTLCPVTEYEKVETAIIEAIAEFENLTCNTYGELIRHFPLMKYVKGFIFSNSKIDGFTVIDRINIVKSGGEENTSSCVRLSSNWICATAYKIYELLKLPPPFKICDLRSIS